MLAACRLLLGLGLLVTSTIQQITSIQPSTRPSLEPTSTFLKSSSFATNNPTAQPTNAVKDSSRQPTNTLFSSSFGLTSSLQPTNAVRENSRQPTNTFLTSSFASTSSGSAQPSSSPTNAVRENSDQPTSTLLASSYDTTSSVQPTSTPTSVVNPNDGQYTSYIETNPTIQPTTSPTNVAEPTLLVGRDYWWVVITQLQLYGDASSSSFAAFSIISRYPQVINRVIGSYLSNALTLAHHNDIVAIDTRFSDGGTTQSIMVNNQSTNTNDSVATKAMYYMNVNVKIWTTSMTSGQDILSSLDVIKQEPQRLVNPLQSAGLSLISDVHIETTELIETGEPPSDKPKPPPPLSPSRVFLIIAGTVVGFFIAACLLGYFVSFCRRHPQPMELLREIRDNYLYPVWRLLVGFVQSWKRLASQGYPPHLLFIPTFFLFPPSFCSPLLFYSPPPPGPLL